MKRVTLREDRAPYLVDEEILSGEPVIVERNGQAAAAVIPMADYEAFLAWRAMLDGAVAWRATAHAGGRPGGAGGGGTDQDHVPAG